MEVEFAFMLPATEATDKSLQWIANQLERIAESLGSIDRSLMTLALIAHQKNDLRGRRLAQRAQALVDAATHADEAYAAADAQLATAKYPREREVLHDLAMRMEDEAVVAWAKLRAFEARHPDIEIPERARWSLDDKETEDE